MSISKRIEKGNENRIKMIKKSKNKEDKLTQIGAFIADIGGRCISCVAEIFGINWRTAKKAYLLYCNECESIKIETRGRKPITVTYPNLKKDIQDIVEEYASTDPDFDTEKRYVRLTIEEIRNRLIETGKYTEENCPKKSCLGNLLNDMGYKLKKVKKTKPLKKIEETDAIFENVHKRKEISLNDNHTVLISIDTKDKVLIGAFSRGGKSRTQVEAVDHELTNNCLIPFGILDMKTSIPYFYNFIHKPTSEAIVDCIEDFWKNNYSNTNKNKLAILLDNGPDNSGVRTFFLKCLIDFSKKYSIEIELIYYPPYHSKYNPVERLWARLENIWNGSLLNTIEICLKFMENLTWNKNKSKTYFMNQKYEKGLTVDKEEMVKLENQHIIRNQNIKKWAITIHP